MAHKSGAAICALMNARPNKKLPCGNCSSTCQEEPRPGTAGGAVAAADFKVARPRNPQSESVGGFFAKPGACGGSGFISISSRRSCAVSMDASSNSFASPRWSMKSCSASCAAWSFGSSAGVAQQSRHTVVVFRGPPGPRHRESCSGHGPTGPRDRCGRNLAAA